MDGNLNHWIENGEIVDPLKAKSYRIDYVGKEARKLHTNVYFKNSKAKKYFDSTKLNRKYRSGTIIEAFDDINGQGY